MKVVSNCQSIKEALYRLERALQTIQREQLHIEHYYIPLSKIEQFFCLEPMTMEKKEYLTNQIAAMYHLLQVIDSYLKLNHRDVTFPVTFNIKKGVITSRLFQHDISTDSQEQLPSSLETLYQLYLKEYTHFYMQDIIALIKQHCKQELGQSCHFLKQGEIGYFLKDNDFNKVLAEIHSPHRTDFKPQDLLNAHDSVYDLIDTLIQRRLQYTPLYDIPEPDKVIQMVRYNGRAS